MPKLLQEATGMELLGRYIFSLMPFTSSENDGEGVLEFCCLRSGSSPGQRQPIPPTCDTLPSSTLLSLLHSYRVKGKEGVCFHLFLLLSIGKAGPKPVLPKWAPGNSRQQAAPSCSVNHNTWQENVFSSSFFSPVASYKRDLSGCKCLSRSSSV